MPVGVLRAYLLGLGLLAALTALVLDGVMLRYVLKPVVRFVEARSPAPVRYPAGIQFMLEHAWARRAYNLVFAAIVLGAWWYLGTPTGARLLH
jgi:hypothetical protein